MDIHKILCFLVLWKAISRKVDSGGKKAYLGCTYPVLRSRDPKFLAAWRNAKTRKT